MLPAFFKKNVFYRAALNIKKKIERQKNERLEKQYQLRRIEFYQTFLKINDLVFDVGANIGNRVEAFRHLQCKVIAVEPQPSCVAILNSKFGDSIIVEEVGLGEQQGTMQMYIADESTISTFSKEFVEKMQHSKFKRNKWANQIEVPIRTLDSLITKHGMPAFCKIDVEGFEAEVLAGLNQPIPVISFEYNVPELSQNVISCVGKLNNLSRNYTYNYSVAESMQLKLQTWMNYQQFVSFVATQEFLNSDFGDIYARLTNENSN